MRQDERRRARNRRVRSQVQTALRKLQEGKPAELAELLRSATSELDNARRKGVLKENTVNRKKSRLTKWVNRQTQAAASN
jgi:small subunit ribosomal protein S20